MLSKTEFQVRAAVIALAFLTPIICLMGYGYMPSLSAYWKTEMQPIFIIANATTSYYLYSMKQWKIPALFLLLLTAFSVEMYGALHNALAIIFFVVTLWPLFMSNHFKWIKWVYLSSLLALPWSMMIAEMIAITALCGYNGLLLHKTYSILKQKHKLS
jgi:hypothetical protein